MDTDTPTLAIIHALRFQGYNVVQQQHPDGQGSLLTATKANDSVSIRIKANGAPSKPSGILAEP